MPEKSINKPKGKYASLEKITSIEKYVDVLKEYLVLGEHKFEQARKANEGCKFYGKFSYLDLYEQAILHLLLL